MGFQPPISIGFQFQGTHGIFGHSPFHPIYNDRFGAHLAKNRWFFPPPLLADASTPKPFEVWCVSRVKVVPLDHWSLFHNSWCQAVKRKMQTWWELPVGGKGIFCVKGIKCILRWCQSTFRICIFRYLHYRNCIFRDIYIFVDMYSPFRERN